MVKKKSELQHGDRCDESQPVTDSSGSARMEAVGLEVVGVEAVVVLLCEG